MDDPIPRKPRVVDNDMDLPIAKLSGLLDQSLDVVGISDVARHGDGASWTSAVDGVDDVVRFFWRVYQHTEINFPGEESHSHQYPQPRPSPPRWQTTAPLRRRCPDPRR